MIPVYQEKKRQSKLQTKLFRGYLTLAAVILLCFSIFFYIFVSRQLLDSQIQTMEASNNSFYNQVEASLKSLDTVSINLNYSSISKQVLDQSFELNISSDMLEEMADLFVTLSGTELKADQMNLYDFSGNVLQAGMSTLIKKSSPDQQDLIEAARRLKGSKILTLPYETSIYTKSASYGQWFISLYRSFNNQYGRPVGVVETAKQCKSVFKSLISFEKKNKNSSSHSYIFDHRGNLIYPYDRTDEEKKQISQYFDAVSQLDSGSSFHSPLDDSLEYAAIKTSKYSGYTYLTVQPQSAILKPVYQLLRILLAAVLIFLFFSALIARRLSRTVIQPVKHLKHIIQRMELDTLGQEQATAYPVSVDELEELYQAFQHMSDSLKSSMEELVKSQEREVKSRTMALQTQINPHFYYNSLSSIIVLAENGDTDVVIKMCRNLSNIMRYITDSSSTTVTLREELDYVRKYLYCMKVRYQSSLDYEITVPEELLSQKVPKLLIQPLVENAIKYGSDCEPPWFIQVRGHLFEDHWQIDVLDNGHGFTREALETIQTRIREADLNPEMPDLKINGLGTLNVYLRWKLFCKNDIIFSCGNTEEGHGIVSIGRFQKKETE